ncbi:MAG: 16S rRNA (guanine(966)-N(2))-methyltransferase RsmD [Hyphomicrobiales bacterium]
MRIVSGNLRGRTLKLPKDMPVRPTTDMAREALFNILNSRYYFDELEVLDLFSGTGAISFEFLSRGVINVCSIEKNPKCAELIRENAKGFQLENINVIRTDAMKFIETSRKSYDLIFADPPFELSQEDYDSIYEKIFQNNLLSPSGLLIMEHNKSKVFSGKELYLSTRKYGKVHFSFFGREEL